MGWNIKERWILWRIDPQIHYLLYIFVLSWTLNLNTISQGLVGEHCDVITTSVPTASVGSARQYDCQCSSRLMSKVNVLAQHV